MAIVIVKDRVTEKDINKAKEEHGSYIKIVVDVKRKDMVIGGEWHVDAEKILLGEGSKQENLWGGGIDIETKNIDLVALINLRPSMGINSQEIIDDETRKQFVKIVKDKFSL